MSDAELADQAFERARLFERIQVLALDVLDERHGDGGFVGHFADDGRNRGKPGDLRGAPAAFAGDDFVALRRARRGAVDGAHDDGLDDALRPDGCRPALRAIPGACRRAAGICHAAAGRAADWRVRHPAASAGGARRCTGRRGLGRRRARAPAAWTSGRAGPRVRGPSPVSWWLMAADDGDRLICGQQWGQTPIRPVPRLSSAGVRRPRPASAGGATSGSLAASSSLRSISPASAR